MLTRVLLGIDGESGKVASILELLKLGWLEGDGVASSAYNYGGCYGVCGSSLGGYWKLHRSDMSLEISSFKSLIGSISESSIFIVIK